MTTRYFCLLLLTSIPLAGAQTAPSPGSPAQGRIRISIENEYVAELSLGPLGHGRRHGKDKADGELELQGAEYVGTVRASVDSYQSLAGLIGRCDAGHYVDSQELTVIGIPVDGFNPLVQTVTFNQTASTGNASNEFLLLKFTPKSAIPLPDRNENGELVVQCHTLIERPQGPPFLPLNDSRWTMEGGGYVIVLPTAGLLRYTDTTVAPGEGQALAPVFSADKSVWTIEVERLH